MNIFQLYNLLCVLSKGYIDPIMDTYLSISCSNAFLVVFSTVYSCCTLIRLLLVAHFYSKFEVLLNKTLGTV